MQWQFMVTQCWFVVMHKSPSASEWLRASLSGYIACYITFDYACHLQAKQAAPGVGAGTPPAAKTSVSEPTPTLLGLLTSYGGPSDVNAVGQVLMITEPCRLVRPGLTVTGGIVVLEGPGARLVLEGAGIRLQDMEIQLAASASSVPAMVEITAAGDQAKLTNCRLGSFVGAVNGMAIGRAACGVLVASGASAQLDGVAIQGVPGTGLHACGTVTAQACQARACGKGFRASGCGLLTAHDCVAAYSTATGFGAAGAKSKVTATGCKSDDSGMHGFHASGNGEMSASNCSASRNSRVGFKLDNGQLNCKQCESHKNGQSGFCIGEASRARVTQCKAGDNGECGFLCSGADSELIAVGCEGYTNRHSGFGAEAGGRLIARASCKATCNFVGFTVGGVASRMEVEEGVAKQNQKHGFWAFEGGQLVARAACKALNNQSHGFTSQYGSVIEVDGATAHQNAEHGFFVDGGSDMRVTGCTADQNGMDGFQACQQHAWLEAHSCRAEANKRDGFAASEGGTVVIGQQCSAVHNSKEGFQSVEWAGNAAHKYAIYQLHPLFI